MPIAPLPEHASLDLLESQAVLIRDLIRSGDEGAIGMVDEYHPRIECASLTERDREAFETDDARLIVARMYGFAGWPLLGEHLELVAEHSFTPIADRDVELSEADAFIVAACLDYARAGPNPDERLAAAHAMLVDHPPLATRSIAALATVGDHVGLAAALDGDPTLVDKPCGPNRWPLLLYATYSRVGGYNPAWSATETVRLLLERGADPNPGFLWHGLVPPFTALTGAFGGGERHQPWHPDRLELAHLLLEAGADPNDGQALYNNGIGGQNHDDPAHLQLLVEFGLGTPQDGPWYRRFGDRLRDPAELLYDELEAAAKRNRPTILRYLIGLGLDLNRPVGRSQLPPARIAAAQDHAGILDILAEHGVDTRLSPTDLALRYSRSNDVAGLESLLAGHPDLLSSLHRTHPHLCANVGAEHAAMLTTLVRLGFDINDRSTTKTPLHHAAEAGDTPRARLLVDHGADPNLTDTYHGATPWGWADHNRHSDTAAYLHPLTHHDALLPEFTIRTDTHERALASPALIEELFDRIHAAGRPRLVTLRHAEVSLTIGVGHPGASVALYLDAGGVPWHATTSEPPEATGIQWAGATGPTRFNIGAYLTPPVARAVASQFVHDPTERPDSVTWSPEGPPA